jgi:hypothetical protein
MITIIDTPDLRHPAYNPVVYILDSTNKNLNGFRYLIKIFDAGTTNLLSEFKVAPRPSDGFGYVDISRILQSRVDRTNPFNTINVINGNVSSTYKYDIIFGEEYFFSWAYDDYQFLGSPPLPPGQNATTLVDLTSTFVHPFQVGDTIISEFNSGPVGDFRDQLIGVFNVVSVVSPYEIQLNLPWIGTGTGIPGTVRFADGSKAQFNNLMSVSGNVTYNAAFNFPTFRNYDENDYLPLNSNSKFMTSMPRDCFEVYPHQELYVNLLTGGRSFLNNFNFHFQNSNGVTFFDNYTGFTNADMLQFNVSPQYNPLILSGDPEWYEFWIEECIEEGDCCNVFFSITPFTPGSDPIIYDLNESGIFNSYCWFTFNYDGQDFIIFFDTTIDQWVIAFGTDPSTPGTVIYKWDFFSPLFPCPPIGSPWTIVGEGGLGGFISPEFIEKSVGCTEITERLRVYINKECPINLTQVLFMDRLGSFISYAFPLRTLEKGQIQRKQFRKELGNLITGNQWGYESYDAGLSNYHITDNKIYTLNSDFMGDCNSYYFEELRSTPYAFSKFDADLGYGFEPNKWYSINVLDTSYTTIRSKNKKMKRYNIDIKLSNDNPVNI